MNQANVVTSAASLVLAKWVKFFRFRVGEQFIRLVGRRVGLRNRTGNVPSPVFTDSAEVEETQF